jgi:hypothetical protein
MIMHAAAIVVGVDILAMHDKQSHYARDNTHTCHWVIDCLMVPPLEQAVEFLLIL